MKSGIEFDGKDVLVWPPSHPSEEVKEELGGRWGKKQRCWKLPPISLNILKLEEWYGEEFVDTAPDFIQDLAREEWGFVGWEPSEMREAEAHHAWGTLYPFQKEAIEYLCCNPHQASLLGLSPGLGKTPTSVVAADILGLKKILILAPVKLARNWRREILKWEETGREIKRATKDDRTPGPEVTVANHEVIQETILRDENGKVYKEGDEVPYLNKKGVVIAMFSVTDARVVKMWVEAGPTKKNKDGKTVPVRERIVQARRDYVGHWDLVICDESILLKARRAVKTFVLATLAKTTDWIWFLSGSPTSKFQDDLFRQLQIMFKRGFTSYWRFAEQFCIVHKDEWGWSVTGDRPGVDPKHYLRDFLFMRDQEEVLPDLPDYIPRPIEIEMLPRQRKAFDGMLDNWIVDLEAADPESLVSEAFSGEDVAVETTAKVGQMTRLQQITSNMATLPKFNAKGEPTGEFYPSASAKEDLLVDLLKQKDEIELPLLVWTWWVPTAESMKVRLDKEFKDLYTGLVIGDMDEEETDDEIEAFKNGELDILVMQMGVGKWGHTMTNVRTVFYHDRTFDADAWLQSLRRVRRIGLKHRPVLIVPFCTNSSDEIVELNLLGKIASISRLTSASLLTLLQDLQPSP